MLLVCFLLLTVFIHSAPIAASLFNKFSVSVSVRKRRESKIKGGEGKRGEKKGDTWAEFIRT